MAEFRKTLEGLPLIVKILLCLVGDIYGILYRLSSGTTKGIVIAIVLFVTGAVCGVFAVIDLICVIAKKEVTVLVD